MTSLPGPEVKSLTTTEKYFTESNGQGKDYSEKLKCEGKRGIEENITDQMLCDGSVKVKCPRRPKLSASGKLSIIQLEFHEPVKEVREHCHPPNDDPFYHRRFHPFESVNKRLPSSADVEKSSRRMTYTPTMQQQFIRDTVYLPSNASELSNYASSSSESEIVFNKKENSLTGINLRYELVTCSRPLYYQLNEQDHERRFNRFLLANMPLGESLGDSESHKGDVVLENEGH